MLRSLRTRDINMNNTKTTNFCEIKYSFKKYLNKKCSEFVEKMNRAEHATYSYCEEDTVKKCKYIKHGNILLNNE